MRVWYGLVPTAPIPAESRGHRYRSAMVAASAEFLASVAQSRPLHASEAMRRNTTHGKYRRVNLPKLEAA
jgi:hypothetical protein